MAQPSIANAVLRPDLAAFSDLNMESQLKGYIATRIMPPLQVSVAAGHYKRILLKSLLGNASADTRRAANGGYNSSKYEYTKQDFSTEERGFAEKLDDREAALFAVGGVDPSDKAEQIARDRCWNTLLASLESDVIQVAVNDVVTAGQTTAAAGVWTDHANAAPIDDVFDAATEIRKRTGMYPDTLAISREIFRNLRRCQQIKDEIIAQGAGTQAGQVRVTLAMLAEIFDLRQVVVSDAIKNIANIAQDPDIKSVFPDNIAWLGITAPEGSTDIQQPGFGRILHWGGDGSVIGEDGMIGVVETYRDEGVRADMLRVRHERDIHQQYQEMAEVITGVGV